MDTPTPDHSNIKLPIALDLVQINNKWLPHISCKLCNGLFRVPIVECSKCKNKACSICLEEKLKVFGKCPLEDNCSNYDDFPYFVNPLIEPLFEDLKILCPGSKNQNQNDQCKEVLKYTEYANHIDHCQLISIKCKNKNCNQQLPKKNMTEHEKNCEFKLVQCDFCDKQFIQKEIIQHQETCQDKLKCNFCHQMVSKFKNQEHLKICDLVEIECPGCKEHMSRQQQDKHLQECSKVPQTCQICGQEMSKTQLKEHKIESCIINQIKAMQIDFRSFKTELQEEVSGIKKELQNFTKVQQETSHQVTQQISALEEQFREGMQHNQSKIDKIESTFISRLDQLVKDQLVEKKKEIEQIQKKLQLLDDDVKDMKPTTLREANQNCGYKDGIWKDWESFEKNCGALVDEQKKKFHDPVGLFTKGCYKCYQYLQRYNQKVKDIQSQKKQLMDKLEKLQAYEQMQESYIIQRNPSSQLQSSSQQTQKEEVTNEKQ